MKRKQQALATVQQKNVCLVKTICKRATERASDISDKPNPCFTPFTSKGFVSLTAGMKDRKEITLLRDSFTEPVHNQSSRLTSYCCRQLHLATLVLKYREWEWLTYLRHCTEYIFSVLFLVDRLRLQFSQTCLSPVLISSSVPTLLEEG